MHWWIMMDDSGGSQFPVANESVYFGISMDPYELIPQTIGQTIHRILFLKYPKLIKFPQL